MNEKNVLVTGTPRAGTTLTCYLLNLLPDVVALHEPMRLRRFLDEADPDRKQKMVGAFCEKQRKSLLLQKQAKSRHIGGKVPPNSVGPRGSDGNLRPGSASHSTITIDKELSSDFILAVKHHAAFTGALGALVGHFPIFTIVRNPLATIASWSSVDFKVQSGHAPAAEQSDPRLAKTLATIPDTIDRQIVLINWFYEQYFKYLPADSIIRYEDVVATGGRALRVICPDAAGLSEPLESQNLSTNYDHRAMLRIGERMLQYDGAIWEMYPKETVTELLAELESSIANNGQR